MFSETAIAEVSIAELLDEEVVPVETTLFLERVPVMIIGDNFFRADMGDDFDQEGIAVELERLGLTIEGMNRDGTFRTNPGSVKILREAWPVVRGTPGDVLNFYFGVQAKTPEDTVAWQGPFPFTIGENASVRPLIEGAYLAYKVVSNGQSEWSLLSIDLDIDRTGEVYDQ